MTRSPSCGRFVYCVFFVWYLPCRGSAGSLPPCSMPCRGVGAIGALLLLVFYVYAVICTKLFGAAFPDWFGSIGDSMYTLFQIMTLESWSMGIVRPVMEVYSWAWLVFVAFIVMSSFTVLNLFIAIIIDSMQTLHETEQHETVEEVSGVVHDEHRQRAMEFDELRREMREIKELLKDRQP